MDSTKVLQHAFPSRVVLQVLKEELSAEESKNMAYSPLSLYAMLNMIATGASGRTLKQLLEFLESESVADLSSKSSRLVALANPEGGGRGGPLVSFVNGIWVDQRFQFKPSYEEIITKIYEAQAKAVDFRNSADQVRDEVNSWVEKSTNGIIKEIVPKKMISKDTILVLANALYFKGRWKQPFYKSMTEEEEFHLLNGETALVPYMTKYSADYYYLSNDDYQLLKLQYRRGQEKRKFSMYIFLPKERNGLNKVIQKYFDADPGFIHQKFKLERVELTTIRIPKFKFTYDFQPIKIMKELGLTLPFDAEKAELTDMMDYPSGFIGNMIQKSGIEVNEEGTEAASSTVASEEECECSFYEPLINFIADHSFIFMIRENTSGVVFFLGAVVNPLL